MRRMLALLLLLATLAPRADADDARVRGLIHNWAPLVWLAPDERFLPLGVPEFLENMQADEEYLRTRHNLQSLLQNRSSFLHGRKPAGSVPIYALVSECPQESENLTGAEGPQRPLPDDFPAKAIESNSVPGSLESPEYPSESTAGLRPGVSRKRRKLKPLRPAKWAPHFHVTYWMFYPFSEGKAVCVLDLGFLGTWPVPSLGGFCLGRMREYGSHVGDWEHVSLYFKGKEHPVAMYVSAHDAGAFYRYEARSGNFLYESQETRKGIFQKPTFPERVYTSEGSHPVLFSARGSHGLWTAPGKHKFVRLPRLYDESGFGTAWPTWRKVELLGPRQRPAWMAFTGKWGNPKSNCHPLAKLGFDICEFVDGPTGIPTKKLNFRC